MIRDVNDTDGRLQKEITLRVKPAFERHLQYLARLYGNETGKAVSVEEYIFAVLAEKVRASPAPTQTREEVEQIAS